MTVPVGKRAVRGLAMTETAIVLPLVLMLLLATAEFGRAFWQYNILSKSVRDGARYAAGQGLFGSTGVVLLTPGLSTEVQNLVVYGNTGGTGAPVLAGLNTSDITLESPGDGDILVRSSYDYAPIFGLIPNFRGGGATPSYTFQAAVRMRAL